MNTFYYSLLLFNLCTALGESFFLYSFLRYVGQIRGVHLVIVKALLLLSVMTAIVGLFCHPTGPWFIGEMIDGHGGACFAFGVFIDGHFLEGSLTYVVGVIQVSGLLGSFHISTHAIC